METDFLEIDGKKYSVSPDAKPYIKKYSRILYPIDGMRIYAYKEYPATGSHKFIIYNEVVYKNNSIIMENLLNFLKVP